MNSPPFDPRLALAGIQMTVFAIFLTVYYGGASGLAAVSFLLAVTGTALTFYSLSE